MSAACGCRPGSVETGWHEIRCAACARAESERWGFMIKQIRNPYSSLGRLIARIKEEHRSDCDTCEGLENCCMTHDNHVLPHRKCILR